MFRTWWMVGTVTNAMMIDEHDPGEAQDGARRVAALPTRAPLQRLDERVQCQRERAPRSQWP